MKRRVLAGVVGGGCVEARVAAVAKEVGRRLARAGAIIVCGGLGGVMEAASRGAAEAGGTVIGILPGPSVEDANRWVTHPVATNMGHARNAIIVQTADFLVAIGGEAGTLSEIAIALKIGKPVFSIESWDIPGVRNIADPDALMEALEGFGLRGQP